MSHPELTFVVWNRPTAPVDCSISRQGKQPGKTTLPEQLTHPTADWDDASNHGGANRTSVQGSLHEWSWHR